LTEAGRLDVRNEIARIAGVSVGNVTKVKQLTTTAHLDILKALREKDFPSIEPGCGESYRQRSSWKSYG
jgi:hypothetical protein